MAQQLTDLRIDEISLVDDPANPEAHVEIFKRRTSKESDMDVELINKALTQAEASLEAQGKELAIYKARAEKAEAALLAAAGSKDDDDDEEEILKSLPAGIRKRLEDGKAAEVALAKAKADAEEGDAITKARAFCPTDADAKTVGPLLLRVAKGKTTADDAETLTRLLKSAAAISARSDLFKSLGADAAGDAVEDPEAILKAKAAEIKKANKGMTDEAAYSEALDQNPELYSAYIAKRRG